MHIAILNERLLARFGVDRILLIIGEHLIRQGHSVTFICLRGDRGAIGLVSPHFHIVPVPPGLNTEQTEASAASWLASNWTMIGGEKLAGKAAGPDLLISGGWPFFSAAGVAAAYGAASAFIDAGAVPHDGFSPEQLPAQRELRRIRARWLRHFTAVFPISDFIRISQTLPDRGREEGVTTVLLGADHLDRPVFEAPGGTTADERAEALIRRAIEAGQQPILGLGRFESTGYKNSAELFQLMDRILSTHPAARLLLLAQPGEVQIPERLAPAVICLGFVSDAALSRIIRQCSLGLAPTLWEGFDLPVVEMQWAARPALALSVGAHPEVIAHPWLLCADFVEMAAKAAAILSGIAPPSVIDGGALQANIVERFRARLPWSRALDQYRDLVEALGVAILPEHVAGRPRASKTSLSEAGMTGTAAATTPRLVLVDCTNASSDPANPGVIRVARRLAACLQADEDFSVIFARWDASTGQYRSLDQHQAQTLGGYDGPRDYLWSLNGGPIALDPLLAVRDPWNPPVLLLPEVVLDGCFPERIVWARARGLQICAVLYDLIPISHAPFCSRDVVSRFPEYLQALAAVDAIWAISQTSLAAFEHYAQAHQLRLPLKREAVWLPAQFAAVPRVRGMPDQACSDNIRPLSAVCIASIEPRKNHRTLIEGFQRFQRRLPENQLNLVLIGNRFAGADDLAHWIEQIARANPAVVWHGLQPDARVEELVSRSAFTVYPSLVEGYGLPITESLWMGRPCLCHNAGVMAELAAGGGCLTVDMHDPDAIADGLARLTLDAALRMRLTQEATTRPLDDWDAYAERIGERLRAMRPMIPAASAAASSKPLRSTISDDRLGIPAGAVVSFSDLRGQPIARFRERVAKSVWNLRTQPPAFTEGLQEDVFAVERRKW